MNIERISLSTKNELFRGVAEIKRFIKSTNDNTAPTVFIIRPVIPPHILARLETEGRAIVAAAAAGTDMRAGEIAVDADITNIYCTILFA
jgi:hypothetical protein